MGSMKSIACNDDERTGLSLLGAPAAAPVNIRGRLHALCALYAHTQDPKARMELLDRLEELALQTGHEMAVDLLENGWRPEAEAFAQFCACGAALDDVRPRPRR